MKAPARRSGDEWPPMRRFRFSTRSLMLAVAVVAVEWLVLIEAARIGPGVAFTLFMASVLVLLDLLYVGYLAAADQINRAPAEEQAGPMLRLGCFLVLLMIFVIPVALVVLLGGRL